MKANRYETSAKYIAKKKMKCWNEMFWDALFNFKELLEMSFLS